MRKTTKSILNSNTKSKTFIKIAEILIDAEGNTKIKFTIRHPTNLIKQHGIN